jgi:hypothetical protein
MIYAIFDEFYFEMRRIQDIRDQSHADFVNYHAVVHTIVDSWVYGRFRRRHP